VTIAITIVGILAFGYAIEKGWIDDL